jgi:hypothetical protein
MRRRKSVYCKPRSQEEEKHGHRAPVNPRNQTGEADYPASPRRIFETKLRDVLGGSQPQPKPGKCPEHADTALDYTQFAETHLSQDPRNQNGSA